MNIDFDALVPQLDEDVFEPKEILDGQTEDAEVEENNEHITDTNEIQEEDIIEEVVEENTSQSNTETETKVEPDEIATLFYKELVENGIATDSNKEGYSWEDVNNVINSYKEDLPKQVTEAIIMSSPEIGQSVIDYVFSKGQNLTKDDLKSFMSDYLSDLENLEKVNDFSDVETAREFLSDVYKSRGIKENQISVMLDVLEDESETALIEEAKKYAELQKSNLKSSTRIAEAKAQKDELDNEMRIFAQSLENELKNTGWKSNRVDKVRQDLTSGITNDVLKKASKSPMGLIQLANLATYYDEKTGRFDFEEFVKQQITPEANQLKEKIKRDMFSTGTNTRGQNSNPNRSKFSELVPITD